MEKIGIFGGTFNPIHKGHIHLIEACCGAFSFDRVLLIPTRVPPHKQAPDLAEDKYRFEMCRLAAEDNPLLTVSDIEIKRPKKSYTYDTLVQLKKEYPNGNFYLIMGSDMFLTFRSWYCWEKMLKITALITAARENSRLKELEAEKRQLELLGGQAFVLDIPVLEISSTEVRERLKKGRDVSGMLDTKVLSYIREHDLYSE